MLKNRRQAQEQEVNVYEKCIKNRQPQSAWKISAEIMSVAMKARTECLSWRRSTM